MRRVVYVALLCAAVLPCPGDPLHAGVSVGVVADFTNLPPLVCEADSELYVRYRSGESTLRYSFLGGWRLDLSVDARLAPRFGAYLPACGAGVRIASTYYYDGAGAFLAVVPCRFDLGPLLDSLFHRRFPEVLVSTCEVRYGSVFPELFSVGCGFTYLFTAELTLLRVSIGI